MKMLGRKFFERDTILVARELLGKKIVRVYRGKRIEGIIMETEAYRGLDDKASHASRGKTERTSIMFDHAGTIYVYLIYGMYHCFNVVTESAGIGAAVLIRAVEPIANISDRACGPGLLCKAMMIDKQCNEHDLLSDNLFIADAGDELSAKIIETPRIGVHYAKEWANKPLRFYIQGNAFVSKG